MRIEIDFYSYGKGLAGLERRASNYPFSFFALHSRPYETCHSKSCSVSIFRSFTHISCLQHRLYSINPPLTSALPSVCPRQRKLNHWFSKTLKSTAYAFQTNNNNIIIIVHILFLARRSVWFLFLRDLTLNTKSNKNNTYMLNAENE